MPPGSHSCNVRGYRTGKVFENMQKMYVRMVIPSVVWLEVQDRVTKYELSTFKGACWNNKLLPLRLC